MEEEIVHPFQGKGEKLMFTYSKGHGQRCIHTWCYRDSRVEYPNTHVSHLGLKTYLPWKFYVKPNNIHFNIKLIAHLTLGAT
jgi:hypothetical protein